MFRYFTITEANEILPTVIKKFEFAKQQKNKIIKIEQELQSSFDSTSTLEKYVNLKQNLNSTISQFYRAIEDLENTGVVIKGLDQGLLDFPSKRFNEDVWLCWKEGETEIKFWHEMDVGFNGRKPITVSDETLV